MFQTRAFLEHLKNLIEHVFTKIYKIGEVNNCYNTLLSHSVYVSVSVLCNTIILVFEDRRFHIGSDFTLFVLIFVTPM